MSCSRLDHPFVCSMVSLSQLLRTTADQVRKRERLKKQRLKLYRAELAAKVS